MHGLGVIEAEKLRDRHRGTERPTGRGVVPDFVVRLADRHPDAGHGLETAQHRMQERRAADLCLLRDCKRSRKDDTARMRDRRAVQVVDLEDVHQATHQKGPAPGVTLPPFRPSTENPAWFGIPSGERVGDAVEDEESHGIEVVGRYRL